MAVNGVCTCLSTYTWNAVLLTCVAGPIPCNVFANTNNVSYAPTCTCDSKYTWNAKNSNCDINCGLIANTNGAASSQSCICANGFTWNGNTLSCVSTVTINCATILYANGATSVNGACGCRTSYYWDQKYLRCNLNCSAVSMST